MEDIEERFRKEFDELGLKPPKNSMPNLERELIIDYWRKAISTHQAQLLKRVREEVIGEDEIKTLADGASGYTVKNGRNKLRAEQRTKLNSLEEEL